MTFVLKRVNTGEYGIPEEIKDNLKNYILFFNGKALIPEVDYKIVGTRIEIPTSKNAYSTDTAHIWIYEDSCTAKRVRKDKDST